jgi:hypothetical protein
MIKEKRRVSLVGYLLPTAGFVFVFLFPIVVAAADGVTIGSILISLRDSLINPLVGVLMTLAIAAFFYGLVVYIWNLRGGKDEGKAIMVWGVVAIFVMVSVWGLVKLLQRTFLGDGQNYSAPAVDNILPGGGGFGPSNGEFEGEQ